MLFTKQPNETINEYINRLGLQREEQDLNWIDISRYVQREFGVLMSADAVRKRYARSIASNNYPTTNNIEQKIDDKADLYRLQAEKLELNGFYRTLSREQTLKDIGTEAANIIAQNKPIEFISSNHDNSNTRGKEAILLIGDWHYGININSTYNVYNSKIANDRVHELFDEVVKYIDFYNVDTLHVVNLGDMIAGNIHLPIRLHSQQDVITQTIEVSELIANFLVNLARWVDINYYSTLDNHSRIDANKKESIQLESLARITSWFLKERLKKWNCIQIFDNFLAPDIVSFKVLNKYNVLAVHGDKDKPNTIIDRLTAFTGEHQDLICSAHYHHFKCEEQNRTMLISNGSLMGTDEFAMDLRLDSKPSQTMIICSDNNVCEQICKINLS